MQMAVVGSVAALWTVAVVTPGPNFLAVARVAAFRSRRAGLAAVGGIGLGTAMWGLVGCFCVQAAFALAPWLAGALRLLGAAYLIVVGVRIVRGSFGPVRAERRLEPGPAFRFGLLTSVSNPKSALFVSALFATVLPPSPSAGAGLAVAAEMVAISVGWYALVAALLTTPPAATAYARARRWVDRVAGLLFAGFGLRLILGHA